MRDMRDVGYYNDPKVNRAIANIRSDADINSHNTNIIFVWSM